MVCLFIAVCASVFLVPSFRVVPLGISLFFESAPDKLPVPVEGVSPARLVDTWGGLRSGGRRHKGIDIFGNRGQAIHSTTKGLVMRVGEDRLGGHTVWVLGPGGEWHYYAHLQQYGDVKAGQWIQCGHIIGTVGDTGNARGTPPHLHYGIYNFSGTATNPYPFFQTKEKIKKISS